MPLSIASGLCSNSSAASTRGFSTRTHPWLIKRVAANRTVLMVEHNLSVVSTLCDTITVLTRGSVLAQGSYAEVSRNPLVRTAYMGTAHA